MTELMLLNSLKKELSNLVKEYDLNTKNKTKTEPSVYEGYLPIKNKDTKEESGYPFIILRLIECEDNNTEFIAKIKIIIGTYDESTESDGWKDVLNIYNKIKIFLIENSIIENKFICKEKIKFNLPEEQPYPYFIGEMITEWKMPKVIKCYNLNEEEDY